MRITVYHGSNYKFDQFSFINMGKSSGTTGAGFGLYFSQSKADALTYGKYIYECNLQLQNNLSNTDVTLNKKTLTLILDKLFDRGKNYYQNFDNNKNQTITNLLEYNLSDTEIIGDIVNAQGGLKDIMEILTQLGYTHTLDNETPEDKTNIHYIVYDLNAIEIINRKTLNEI